MTKKNKSAIQRRLIPTYIFLIIVSFISVFPLYWMISAATNTSTDVSRGRIIPGSHFMENFRNLTSQQPLWRALGNSFFYAILTTVICLLVCSIAGYGFEVYHDKWKDRVFSILLLAMMVPQVATMVPLFKNVLQGRTFEYSSRFYPSDYFHAVYDHDVPSECQIIPG